MDMIAASGGVISESHGQIVVARFPAFQDGMLAARRLQWALEGLLEMEVFHSTSLAVLVQSADDALAPKAKDASLEALARCSSAQILFGPRAARFAESMPGFVFGDGRDKALRELKWRGPTGEQTRSRDDDAIAQLIERKGPEAKAKAFPVHGAASSSATLAGRAHAATNARSQGEGATGQPSTRIFGQPRGRMLWIGGVALAAGLILAAIPVYHFLRPSTPSVLVVPSQSPVGSATPAQAGGTADADQKVASGSPTQSDPGQVSEPVHETVAPLAPPQEKPNEKKDRSSSKSEHGKSSAASEQAGSPTRRGCDLDQSEIRSQLALAESNQARGKYSDAQRQFETVLACEPGNARAVAGLKTVRQAVLLNR
jgi:hypothetical protein